MVSVAATALGLWAPLLAAPANALTTSVLTPRTALMFGDSLTYESRFQIAARIALKTGWTVRTHSFGYTAPCDWLGWLPADLATYHPSVVGILTAGNAGARPCMTDSSGNAIPAWSDAYYAKYRADLDAFFATATATGAKVVFFSAPPFADPAWNAAAKQITLIATDLAFHYHGVSIDAAVRTQLSNNGQYIATKPCLTTETPAMGCGTDSRIPIRTLPGLIDSGLHLCPTGLQPGTFGVCSVYSSGEYRFGRAVANGLTAPPPPKLL